MSKVLNASCEAGVVTCQETVVEEAELFSEGVAASEGLLIQDKDKAFYIAKTSEDLKITLQKLVTTLTRVSTALEKTADALTSLDTAGFLIAATGGTPSGPVAASDITAIGTAQGQIDTLKDELDTLRTNLK